MNLEEIFQHVSNGNSDAYTFCRSFYEFVHMIDDLIDRDKPFDIGGAMFIVVKLVETIGFNPFFQKHKAQLLPVIHTSAMAYASSERLKTCEDIQGRVASEVLKSQYQDVFLYVAFLTGGSAFALECDVKYRGYSFG